MVEDVEMDAVEGACVVMVGAADEVEVTSVVAVARKPVSKTLHMQGFGRAAIPKPQPGEVKFLLSALNLRTLSEERLSQRCAFTA